MSDEKKVPDVKAAPEGRGYKLEHGGGVAIFDSTPDGFYAFQIKTVPDGEVQFFLSNQGAAALFLLLLNEFEAGRLKDGLAKMPLRKEVAE